MNRPFFIQVKKLADGHADKLVAIVIYCIVLAVDGSFHVLQASFLVSGYAGDFLDNPILLYTFVYTYIIA